MQNGFYVRKVAVLGAGVMGAQIAAHFGNAGVSAILFDLKSKSSQANELIEKSLLNLKKLNPKPLAWNKSLDYISVANYDDNLEKLKDCDLIIEAIAERLDWKEDLYKKIAPYINSGAIVASNTSGLSIDSLAKCLPEVLRNKFCGIHFFNPPRYMALVELIPSTFTDKHILPDLETFLVTNLGKNVVVAKDTPNFIANRVGVFSMLAACIHTEKFNIPLEVVDKLTGKDLARAKSATYRTADIVGLDTLAHVIQTMADNCKDGFEQCYKIPVWLENLIINGCLGQKTKAGFYKKDKAGINVLDLSTGEYRKADKKANPEVIDILRQKDWTTKFDKLHSSELPEAKFLWACFRDVFHYASHLLGDIADTPRDIDLAIRSGFGWKDGIFEIWQQAGFNKIALWIKEDIEKGLTLSNVPLPKWVFEQKDGVYLDNKHFNIVENKLVERKELPVYKRQLFPDMVLNEKPNFTATTLYENDGVRLWHTGDNIGILSFKTKMSSIGMDVLNGIDTAIDVACEKCVAMVIWQEKDIFSVGANLEEFGFSIMMNGAEAVDDIVEAGHRIIVNKLRYCKIPVIAAVRGFVFGGGCEIMLHCDGVVAALESYIGLIEAGVGLLPGWGGTTEMAYRASQAIDPWKDFERRYKNLAMAQVATSAYEALEMGFLRDSDTIIMNTREVLYVAKERAKFMSESGYRPPIKPTFAAFGSQGIAIVNGLLANMYAGGQISDHDMLIAKNIAATMCGGEIEKDSKVSEDWVLNIEKQKFQELATSQKTADRIQYMLENGKPLRN
ncbi:MAG: 3-hydroxyacyl-CoA dehydrogenase/enoyl-CoA hydratase family protein [Proteobacteria bacterium]|jgi:3-hydroxyacyl-CoA dehydrogenase|nr:3-hydroxyacyl-CoA dehydrogenase/enoyl-CoA hydratase family protein [Pseudomonadota bacterium]